MTGDVTNGPYLLRRQPRSRATRKSLITVFTPTSVILYVEDVNASTTFYRRVLDEEPVETLEGFAVFAPTEDVTPGLQARDGIDPGAVGAPGSVELSMSNATRDDVDRLHRSWSELGFPMALEPTELAFGYTFVATDPSEHRFRVCATDMTNL